MKPLTLSLMSAILAYEIGLRAWGPALEGSRARCDGTFGRPQLARTMETLKIEGG